MYEQGSHLGTTLSTGVYFTQGRFTSSNLTERTSKYSYIKYHHMPISEVAKGLSDYTETYNDPNNKIIGSYGHIEGKNNYGGTYPNTYGTSFDNFKTTPPSASHIEGMNNILNCEAGHIEGENNLGIAPSGSHIEGTGNNAILTLNASYTGCVHVEGESNKVKISGRGGHTEGYFNSDIILNDGDHVEGGSNTLTNNGSFRHVQNAHNTVSGSFSSGSGYGTEAKGNQSDAGGYFTLAEHRNSFVRGEYNSSGAEN